MSAQAGASERAGGAARADKARRARPTAASWSARLRSPKAIGVVVSIVALFVVPPAIGGFLPRALSSYLIFGLLALSVGLISGYGRLFNLGIAANFGIMKVVFLGIIVYEAWFIPRPIKLTS